MELTEVNVGVALIGITLILSAICCIILEEYFWSK